MIKVLFIRVPSDEMYDEVFTSLQDKVSEECLVEAGSFRNKGVVIRRVLGEALTVFALRKYFGMPFGSYRFARGEKGKPFVAEREGVFFNISHSGIYVVCAVSDGEIGVDIEKRSKARMEVAGRFFHAREVRELEVASGVEQDKLFYDYWSVKESFLKYTGTGLTRPLNSFVVRFSDGKISLSEGTRELPLYVYPCLIDTGYACYVCGEYNEKPALCAVSLQELIC
ncbi:4'-phosphopantetheinyl transferase family protein [Butyricimonas hominis]|jgi:4'-phosphopantetheinyl transferase sfp|uniref:4'-phosphopantetheinyl transferase superfamily protein n=1 Tax=Butyricimonas hominis TaxID=2763032 RepID=A0ABR7CV93_9BACT|nr:4'-phosphopantetheinyl transferase superfamily protein [Butyricimonas hominis]MBC5619552.1 4'-phosphopantetheinyl transferase superfamily protein [Butyricimonas hominis]